MQTGGSALQSLWGGLADFLAWWREELSSLVPERLRRVFTPSRPDMVLAQVDGGFLVVGDAPRGGRPAKAGSPVPMSAPEAISRLANLARSRGEAAVGLRFPADLCFARSIELPAAARKDLRQILDFDLERATPFKHKDVYAAHLLDGDAPAKGKLRVRQLVVKREAVDPLAAEVRAAGLDVGFADCWTERPSAGLPLNFLEPRGAADRSIGRLFRPVAVLAGLVVLLAVSALVVTLYRYEDALSQLQAQTAQARAQAVAVRGALERSDAAVGDLARLQDLRLKRISAIEILEDLARVLPDTVWLGELRLEGDVLDISGLAPSAAGLPPLFERSENLADAALTAPVTLDQREDKERFGLRLRVKHQAASRQAASGEKK